MIKAVASALKHHPAINASVDPEHDQIIYKEYVNIGIAVDTERGLVVPSLRAADELSDQPCRIKVLGLPSKFLPQGKPDRIHAALLRQGEDCGPQLVRDIMRELGLVSCQPRPWRPTTTR